MLEKKAIYIPVEDANFTYKDLVRSVKEGLKELKSIYTVESFIVYLYIKESDVSEKITKNLLKSNKKNSMPYSYTNFLSTKLYIITYKDFDYIDGRRTFLKLSSKETDDSIELYVASEDTFNKSIKNILARGSEFFKYSFCIPIAHKEKV